MHILGHPRNVAVVGIVFVVIGFIYWLVPYVDAPGFEDYAGVVMLGAVMSILDTTVVNVAIDHLSGAFHASLTTIQ